MKFIYSLFVGLALFSLPMTATALTFKKGQVLGPDGQVYDGASPQLRARLVAEAEAGGRSAGVAAGQLFVVVQGTVTFVPLTEIAGKSEEVVKDIVVEEWQTVTKALTVEALANAGVEVENLSEEALENPPKVISPPRSTKSRMRTSLASPRRGRRGDKGSLGEYPQEDLAEATAYAADFAAKEAAKIARAEDISAQLDGLIASGATEEEIDAFMEANPPVFYPLGRT